MFCNTFCLLLFLERILAIIISQTILNKASLKNNRIQHFFDRSLKTFTNYFQPIYTVENRFFTIADKRNKFLPMLRKFSKEISANTEATSNRIVIKNNTMQKHSHLHQDIGSEAGIECVIGAIK